MKRSEEEVIEAECVGSKTVTIVDAAGARPRLRIFFGQEAVEIPIVGATRVDGPAVQLDVEYHGRRSVRVELVQPDRGVAVWSEPGLVAPDAPTLFPREERYVTAETRKLYRQEVGGCPGP